MSTRFEWFDAESAAVEYVEPGHAVDDGEPSDDPEYTAERGALVISGDEAAVLHGDPYHLRKFLQRALAALPPERFHVVRHATLDRFVVLDRTHGGVVYETKDGNRSEAQCRADFLNQPYA